MPTIDLFDVGPGATGYSVELNGVVCVRQEFDPDQPGVQPMTPERAAEAAAVVAARLDS